jgi:hypothetical protein
MSTVPKTFNAITTLAMRQGFRSPVINIGSIENLAKVAGYRPTSGNHIIKRDLDYLFDVSIETNVYQIIGVDKRKNRKRFHLIDIEEENEESGAQKYHKIHRIKLNDIVFQAMKNRYARFFPITVKKFFSLTPYEMRFIKSFSMKCKTKENTGLNLLISISKYHSTSMMLKASRE